MIEAAYRPAFFECDGLGHINNTRIPQWFERAREPVFDWFHPNRNFEQWRLLVARIEVNFLAELNYGELVRLVTGISRIGNTSFHVRQEAQQSAKTAAEGITVMVHTDYRTGKPAPLPLEIRGHLEAHLWPLENI
jgi:acyl-CoA thioester hydrolase